jgi:phosphoserine aminotransferase
MVIIREDMLKKVPENLPSMLKYTTYSSKNSMFNTPPCFAVYVIQLVMKWLEETIGGLEKMAEINQKKARILYEAIDSGGFYNGMARPDSRSLMNVTFRLPDEALEKRFIEQALENGMGGLKGHRSVGGCRASIYNATSIAAVETLVDFMKTFEQKNG